MSGTINSKLNTINNKSIYLLCARHARRVDAFYLQGGYMQEVWKDIKGYEGLYQVSNLGKVKRLGNNKQMREKTLKERKGKGGYLQVLLCEKGAQKSKYVHQLVAFAFIPNPNNYKEINHKDENKINNSVENLEWCNHKYNCNYGTRNKRLTGRKPLNRQ